MILGLLVSALTLYLALRDVSLWEVSRSVRQASTGWVLLGLVSVLANTLFKGIRWYRLTGEIGRQAGWGRVTAALIAGQLLNLIYPARAGDVSRILIVGQDGQAKAFALGSVLLEKLTDLVAYILLAAVLLVQLPFPDWLTKSVYLAAGLTVAGLAAVIWLVSNTARSERFSYWLAARHVRLVPERIWLYFIELVRTTLSATGIIKQRKQAGELLLWTALVWFTALSNNYLIWLALGMNLSQANIVFQAVLLVLIGLMAGIALPSIPGRIGIFEYICVMALGVFGIEQAPALTYGILLHAVVFLPALVLGAAALLWLSWKPARQSVPPAV